MNILTFDVEDWHLLLSRKVYGAEPSAWSSDRLARQLDLILGCLAKHRVRATFFVLGTVAEKDPGIVRAIAGARHEIASHGSNHQAVFRQSPAQFRQDVRHSRDRLQDLIGREILGYRAPEFSVVRESLWALEVLAELGFQYSSSVFPIGHRRYGIHDFPRWPQVMRFNGSLELYELPLATIRLWKRNLPVAGGGYFRLWPLSVLRWALRQAKKEKIPFVAYFHPYEFDPEYLRIPSAPQGCCENFFRARKFELLQNLGRRALPQKLDALLSEFRFCACEDYLADVQRSGCSNIFREACCTV